MSLKKYIAYFIGYICVAGGLYAQELNISATVDSNNIFVGDWVKLSVEVTKTPDVKVQLPVFNEEFSEGIELIDQKMTDTSATRYAAEYTITSYDSGLYYIPPIPVLVQRSNGITDTLYTEPGYLEVQPFYLADLNNEIADIDAIHKVKYIFRDFLWIIILVIVIAATTWAGYQLWYKRKHGHAFVKPAPIIPPYVTATERLQALEKQKLWQHGKLKEFYTELTETLRWYIEAQYKIPALEQTSDQIIDAVKLNSRFDQDSIKVLNELLPLADMVKFAKGTTDATQNVRYLEQSMEFVKRTKEQWLDAENQDRKEVAHV